MKLATSVLIVALSTVAACGNDTSNDDAADPTATTDVAPSGSEFASLAELLEAPESEDGTVVIVSAVLFDDGSGPRMCEALAESLPPQCAGRSLALDVDLLEVEWTEQDGVRWTDRPVSLFGWVEGTTFVAT